MPTPGARFDEMIVAPRLPTAPYAQHLQPTPPGRQRLAVQPDGLLERRRERVADTNDRRITWFELTDRGAAALTAPPTAAFARARVKILLASLTESEREGFVKVANAFADAVESVLGAAADPGAPDPS